MTYAEACDQADEIMERTRIAARIYINVVQATIDQFKEIIDQPTLTDDEKTALALKLVRAITEIERLFQ